MGAKSRDKGARFERWVADYFTQQGYVCHRSAQYCGNTGDAPDVVGLPYIHIECKAYKDTEWDDSWIDQAKRDSNGKTVPVVIHKTDYHKPKATLTGRDLAEMMIEYVTNNHDDLLVTMELDDFTKMYREYEASRYLSERSNNEG